MVQYDALQMKRDVDICLSNGNIVFYSKLGIMNTYLMEHYTNTVLFSLFNYEQLFNYFLTKKSYICSVIDCFEMNEKPLYFHRRR